MAVTCAFCGVSMTTAEVTQRPYDGVVGNYHRDCAYEAYLLASGPVTVDPVRQAEVNVHATKLKSKKATQAVPGITAPAGSLIASTNLGVGTYKYAVTFVDIYGETTPGAQFSITTTSGNQGVSLTSIPVGPSVTTKRRVYRTAVGGSQLKLLTTISNNTTTTFSDTTADASLGANAPAVSSFATSDYP
jgi:hypothetical protein